MSKYLLLNCIFFYSHVQVFGQSVSLTVQTGHSSRINKICFSPNGKLIASAGSDSRILVWDVNAGKQLLTITGHNAAVNDISFSPDSEKFASASDDGKVIIWDLETGTESRTFEFKDKVKGVCYSHDGSRLGVAGKRISVIEIQTGNRKDYNVVSKAYYNTISFSGDDKLLAFGGNKDRQLKIVNVNDVAQYRSLSLKANHLVFSADDRYLIGAGVDGNLKRWDLQDERSRAFSMTAERKWQSYLAAGVNEHFFAGGNKNKLISIFDIVSGNKVKVLNGHSGDVTALSFSPEGSILASAGIGREIILWDTQDWEIIKSLKGTAEKINAIEFTGNEKSLVIGYGNGSFRYWQLEPGGEMVYNHLTLSQWKQFQRWSYTITGIKKIEGREITLEAFRAKRTKRSSEYKIAKKYLVKWSLDQNSYTTRRVTATRKDELKAKQFYVKEEELLRKTNLTKVGNQFKVFYDDSIGFGFQNKENQNLIISEHNHSDKITAVDINEGKGYAATASWDGLIKLWDLKTGKLMMNLLASNEFDYIFITPDNNYFSTKGALGNIGFKVGSQIFSFGQFDLQYNRPDLVLQGLHYADTTLIYAYRMAHLKRIQKAGSSSKENTFSSEIPEVSISTKNKEASSKEKHIQLIVDAKAKGSPIRKLHVLINGVPIYGNGLAVNKSSLHEEIKVELSYGLNVIECFVTNNEGISSLQQSLQVTYKSARVKPDLYLVTIGASNYKDKTFDLRYAAKDAQDIEALFRQSKRFQEVKTISLVNEEVDLKNINKITDFLAKTRVDDVVIITYSGHGLFDRNLEYFLSTYHMDFDNPNEGGLAYSEMEKLLEGCISRNKVLVVDACHSGEIDKEEVELSVSSTKTEEGEISFRNVGPSIRNKSGALRNSFELSKALFADDKTTHGAAVISSASGGEYAIEGKEWMNGVFTHCFIKGLKKMKADQNKDGHVTIAELQRYLGKEVYTMTGGKQTPTSRDENLSNNFIIW